MESTSTNDFEVCVKHSLSSIKYDAHGMRKLVLTVHFQEAQYPPRSTKQDPLFSYSIHQAQLSVTLHNAQMPINLVEPINLFQLESKATHRSSTSGETGGGAEATFSQKDGLSGKANISGKTVKSLGKEFIKQKSLVELIHNSDTELYLKFDAEGEALIGTLKDRLLGQLHYSSKARAISDIRVLEKDIKRKKLSSFGKGLVGFVAFKKHGFNIAKEINNANRTEIYL